MSVYLDFLLNWQINIHRRFDKNMAIDKPHLHFWEMVWVLVAYKHLKNILGFSASH